MINVSICQELQTGTWRFTVYLEAHGTQSQHSAHIQNGCRLCHIQKCMILFGAA